MRAEPRQDSGSASGHGDPYASVKSSDREIGPGDQVIVKTADGSERQKIAVSWAEGDSSHDFPVIWVAEPNDNYRNALPWPIEDVRLEGVASAEREDLHRLLDVARAAEKPAWDYNQLGEWMYPELHDAWHALTRRVVAQFQFLTRSEGVTDAVATPKSGGGR